MKYLARSLWCAVVRRHTAISTDSDELLGYLNKYYVVSNVEKDKLFCLQFDGDF